jgi:hypothetical protein
VNRFDITHPDEIGPEMLTLIFVSFILIQFNKYRCLGVAIKQVIRVFAPLLEVLLVYNNNNMCMYT